jgi:NAD-dependent deacetylase
LHRLAGSKRMVEFHGHLFTTRCSNSRCKRAPCEDRDEHQVAPKCDECGANLRPDIVWFGESIAQSSLETPRNFMERAARGEFIFIVVGSSLQVSPANWFVEMAKQARAKTVLVNEEVSNDFAFDITHQGKAAALLPRLLGTSGAT